MTCALFKMPIADFNYPAWAQSLGLEVLSADYTQFMVRGEKDKILDFAKGLMFGPERWWEDHEWQDIKSAPVDPPNDPPLVILWMEGKKSFSGLSTFGRCYKGIDGKVRGVATNVHGDFEATHWMCSIKGPKRPDVK